MRIERAGVRDLSILYEIEKKCFGREAYSKFLLRLLLMDPRTIALKYVEKNGLVTGFAIGRIEKRRGRFVGRIYTLNVDPDHRRRGIGKSLMKALEVEFRKKGCVKVSLEVAVDNEAAISLYKSLGYSFLGKLKNYYGPRRDAFLAVKKLR
ncbi:MAG: GNAT family N-acetyltransferase [Thaumarchaeota archaeon]|nr:GNAT family N-acetyltransferase [Nitrososphaerota archaeon]